MTIQQLYIFHLLSRPFPEDSILGISSSLYHHSSRLFHEDFILGISAPSYIRHLSGELNMKKAIILLVTI